MGSKTPGTCRRPLDPLGTSGHECGVWSSRGHRQARTSCDQARGRKWGADGEGDALPYNAYRAVPDQRGINKYTHPSKCRSVN